MGVFEKSSYLFCIFGLSTSRLASQKRLLCPSHHLRILDLWSPYFMTNSLCVTFDYCCCLRVPRYRTARLGISVRVTANCARPSRIPQAVHPDSEASSQTVICFKAPSRSRRSEWGFFEQLVAAPSLELWHLRLGLRKRASQLSLWLRVEGALLRLRDAVRDSRLWQFPSLQLMMGWSQRPQLIWPDDDEEKPRRMRGARTMRTK